MKNEFITLEGIDCSGKSTIMTELKERYDEGFFTREPDESSWSGEIVRDKISNESTSDMTVLFLFIADHSNHIDTKIKPNLDKKIFCDRYVDSRYAYQSVSLNDYIDDNVMEWIINIHDEWTVYPDKTIYLDIPAEVSIRRMNEDNNERFEKENFLRKVRKKYLKLSEIFEDRFYKIDATQSKEQVLQETIGIIEED